MYTYQDLLETNEENIIQFIRNVIIKHEQSDEFIFAKDAREYYQHKNVTISKYQKILYEVTGKAIPDTIGPNYKMASNFFYRFITQENQYLLGNGVSWDNDSTRDKLSNDQFDFDMQLQIAGREALIEGVSFGFWNHDHVEVFTFTEFAPLYDEQTGALRAGVRYWQIDENKPLRATLYEEDGYTEYKWDSRVSAYDKGEIVQDKTPYVLHTQSTEIDGITIVDGENYPTFPIIPLYANPSRQSELIGLREQIDCYDLIKSGFANTVDEASIIYWTLQNAGGMDEIDLKEFVDRLRRVHVVTVDDEVQAESHQMDVPYASREALLDRLRTDLYEDAMAFDPKSLASGGSVVTAAIKAAYDPLDIKCNEYEYQILKFIQSILRLVGIKDRATFTRSKIINAQEEVNTVLMAASYLPPEYVTRKVLTLFGDGDQAESILDELEADQLKQFNSFDNGG